MKISLLFLLATIQLVILGQTTPVQKEIPDYVLIGKSNQELRIMRNEIFARYGYIFNSKDLTEYFSSKPWYNPHRSNVDNLLTATDKHNISLIRSYEQTIENSRYGTLYSSETKSYKKFILDESTGEKIEKTKEVSFHNHFNLGTIRKIVEKTFYGGESVPTVVYAETIEEDFPYWEATSYANDMKFFTNYFYTVVYGCCGAEHYYELFNYKSQSPILKSNEKVFEIDIPNSKIDMFIGYDHQNRSKQSLEVAVLTLTTIEAVVNSVTFKCRNKTDLDDLILHHSPKIEIKSKSDDNIISDDGMKINLWESNFAKSLNDVSGFSIYLEFIGDSSGRKASFEIPIINGRLNGVPSENIELIVDLK